MPIYIDYHVWFDETVYSWAKWMLSKENEEQTLNRMHLLALRLRHQLYSMVNKPRCCHFSSVCY